MPRIEPTRLTAVARPVPAERTLVGNSSVGYSMSSTPGPMLANSSANANNATSAANAGFGSTASAISEAVSPENDKMISGRRPQQSTRLTPIPAPMSPSSAISADPARDASTDPLVRPLRMVGL